MLQKLKNLKNDELVKGSLVLFIMINIFNVLNYIFHFSMARMLGASDYGILAVLFSFIYIFSIPSEAIQNVITSYTSKLNLKKENKKIKYLLYKSLNKGIFVALIIFIIFILTAFFLSSFIKVEFFLIVYTGLLIFWFLLLPIVRGILQGQKKIFKLGINLITEGFLKVILAIAIVSLGFKVYGAMTAVIAAVGISFFLAFLFIKDILKEKAEKTKFEKIYSFSIPFFVAILAIVLMYSIDIILAKRFFSAEQAGKYAVASMLGKIIFFGTFAVSKAMFPLTSEKNRKDKHTKIILKKALKIMGLISFFILLLYLIFPELVIKILYGKQYIEISNILFILGLTLTFTSFSNILILYGLSVNKIKKSSFLLFLFVLLEIVLFYFFHSTLLEFSIVFLVSNFLFLLFCVILTNLTKKKV